MRLAYIVAGAGGSRCGACVRDAALVRALRGRGLDVLLTPLYTPLRIDGPSPAMDRVFCSGISVWLDQKFAWFRRRRPGGLLDRIAEHPFLLRAVSRFAAETRPEKLGPTAVSVLQGREGFQAREFERLCDFLAAHAPPEVAHIGNSLLLAPAPMLKERFGCPVLCHYQGEGPWIRRLGSPWAEEAVRWIRRYARHVDLFTIPFEAAVPDAVKLLGTSPERLRVLPPCIDTSLYPDRNAGPAKSAPGGGNGSRGDVCVVGFLSRIVPDKGPDMLAEAVRKAVDETGRRVRLRFAGPLSSSFRRRFRAVLRAVRSERLEVEYVGELDYEEKVRFLQHCDWFSVPSRIAEYRGTAVLEAMACGAPVVLPSHGVYVDILRETQGGVTSPWESGAEGLAAAFVEAFALSNVARRELGRRAASGVRRVFDATAVAGRYVALLDEVVSYER